MKPDPTPSRADEQHHVNADGVVNVVWLTDWPQPSDINDCIVNLPEPPTEKTRIRVGGDPTVWKHDGRRWAPVDQEDCSVSPELLAAATTRDYLDIPAAWLICREGLTHTSPECSYVTEQGALLCDCGAVEARWEQIRREVTP